MRIKGKLISWNDDRGFGFIEPIQGGQQIFVHIKAFSPRRGRPQVNELFWFEIELGPEGKQRAKNVEVIRRATPSEEERASSTQSTSGSLVAVPGFVLLYVVVGFLWRPPLVLVAIYVTLSTITYFVYARDKAAAQQGAWRTSERTLQLLALAGGWPGALLAQQLLRHKSKKSEFQLAFWGTVILNVTGFILFCSPLGQQLWVTLN